MNSQPTWTANLPSFPTLHGHLAVDVLVVGGGITGLTTAVLLQEAGCRVAVVERQTIGAGETGHTTAHLTQVTDARLDELVRRFGRDGARAFWDAGRAAMQEINRLAAGEEAECELAVVPGHLAEALDSEPGSEEERLRAEAEQAGDLGFAAEFVSCDPVFSRPAVRYSNQMKFHPLRYLKLLLKRLTEGGGGVFEHTEGSGIDGDAHTLFAPEGSISYETLVTATHAPVQGERGALAAAVFQTKLAAYSTYAIEAGIDCVPESLYWDTADPYHHFRFERGESGCRVIVGGEDHKTGQEKDTEESFGRLAAFLRTVFPAARPQRRWAGQVIETPDGLPYIGEVGGRQFLATGFAGNGMTLGTFSGMVIRDLIVGRTNPWAALFSPRRMALRGGWRYLRENMDFPLHFLGDRLSGGEESGDTPRNTGAVVVRNGRRCAEFIDSHGKRTTRSAVCPHLGCVVHWNAAEKTWDCPCHGSRFMPTGELLAGPAESGLATLEQSPSSSG